MCEVSYYTSQSRIADNMLRSDNMYNNEMLYMKPENFDPWVLLIGYPAEFYVHTSKAHLEHILGGKTMNFVARSVMYLL